MVDWIRSTVAEVSILGKVTTVQAEKLSFVKDVEEGGSSVPVIGQTCNSVAILSGLRASCKPDFNDKRPLTNTILFHEGKKGFCFVLFFFT